MVTKCGIYAFRTKSKGVHRQCFLYSCVQTWPSVHGSAPIPWRPVSLFGDLSTVRMGEIRAYSAVSSHWLERMVPYQSLYEKLQYGASDALQERWGIVHNGVGVGKKYGTCRHENNNVLLWLRAAQFIETDRDWSVYSVHCKLNAGCLCTSAAKTSG